MKLSFEKEKEKEVLKEYSELTQRKVELLNEVEGLNKSLDRVKYVAAMLQTEIEQEIVEATEKVTSVREEVAGLESTAANLNEALKDELSTAWMLREQRHPWFHFWFEAEVELVQNTSEQKRQELLVANREECQRWASEVKRTNMINFINEQLEKDKVE